MGNKPDGPETTAKRSQVKRANEAEKNVEAWLLVHADACRTHDGELRRRAVERIAFWTDEVLQHD